MRVKGFGVGVERGADCADLGLELDLDLEGEEGSTGLQRGLWVFQEVFWHAAEQYCAVLQRAQRRRGAPSWAGVWWRERLVGIWMMGVKNRCVCLFVWAGECEAGDVGLVLRLEKGECEAFDMNWGGSWRTFLHVSQVSSAMVVENCRRKRRQKG